MRTSELERIRRDLADVYMAEHPGVPRQEAKRRVAPTARQILLTRHVIRAARQFVRAFSGRA